MSSLLKSLALLCMWAGASAESQWCDVASDSTGKYLVAVGYACSKVLISDDFGVTWQYTKAPAQYWGSIYSDSTGQKLIIGPHWTGGNPASTSQMMYSTDRGATWTAGTYNNEVTTSVTLPNKISADSATQHVVTVTESQKLIQSRNGGASWVGVDNVPYNKTAGYNGYASALSSSGSYFYASNDVGQIYLSTDAGVTFYKKQEACSTCGGVWKNFVTDSTGKILFANTVNQFYMSTDAGVTMKQINDKLAVGSTIVDIYTDSAAKYAYVLTLDGLYVYTRSTGTFVKNALKMVVNQGVGAYSVSASASGQHIIVSVQPEGLYVSDDFGVTWLNIRGLTSK